MLVAPYYGATKDGTRSGFADAFLERIRKAEYPQFLLDKLPAEEGESVLRLDHVHAVGCDPDNFSVKDWALADEALEVVLDWFRWLVEGNMPSDSTLQLVLDLMQT